MKTINFWIGYIVVLFGIFSCTQKDLYIPALEAEKYEGEVDLIPKPSDVILTPNYDYGFNIKWPLMNDKVKKVVFEFVNDTLDKEPLRAEFTDFKKDTIIFGSGFGVYKFNIISYDAEGKASSSYKVELKNRDLYAKQILSESLVSQSGRFGRVRVGNPLKKKLKIKIKNSLVEETFDIDSAAFTQYDFPIVDDGSPDLAVEVYDFAKQTTASKQYAFNSQYMDFSYYEKEKWTLFYDSPYNHEGWWNLGEAFDGFYTVTNDLDGIAKIAQYTLGWWEGITKINSDRRIRNIYVTFTQESKNWNKSNSQVLRQNRYPEGPYDNILVGTLTFIFKSPTITTQNHEAVWPTYIRIYGIREKGNVEELVTTISDVDKKLVPYKPSDPSWVKSIAIDLPQTSYESSVYKGLRVEIANAINTGSDSWELKENQIGLGELFVKGMKTSL